MKKKVIWGVAFLLLCVLSGIVGAYSVTLLRQRMAGETTLQVRRLELTDAQKNVKAVFSVEDDGSVFLRMLSKGKTPIIELGVSENPTSYKLYTPTGSLTIRDGAGTPAIQLRTVGKGEGVLSFSSTRTPGLVSVGYRSYGDVIDDHDRGAWGIHIVGPDHKSTGLKVFTMDGAIQGFTVPLEAPRSAMPK